MQIKSWTKQYRSRVEYYLQRLSDVRFAGQIVFVIVVLMISWSGVKAIQTNYGLQKQVSVLQQQNAVQTLQNDNLSLQNQYYNSNQYLELAARQDFGLAAPGEKEILVPASVADSYTISLPSLTQSQQVPTQPSYQSNLQSWVDFFLHSGNTHN